MLSVVYCITSYGSGFHFTRPWRPWMSTTLPSECVWIIPCENMWLFVD